MSTPAEITVEPGAGRPAESLPAPGGSGISVLRSLRRHLGLATLTASLILLAGLPLAWIKGAPRYSATAVVFVSPHFVATLQDGKEVDPKSDAQYHEYIQQNAKTINRFDILHEALTRMGSGAGVWVKSGESLDRAAERLQAALNVAPVPDTYQIAVTLENGKAEHLADLINTVVAVYLEKAKKEEFYASDDRVKILLQDRDTIQHEIEARQSRRLDIAQELGVSSFSDNFVNPYDRLLVGAKEALAVARRQDIEAEAQVAALDVRLRKDGSDALRAMAEAEATKDVSLTALDSNQSIRRTQLLTAMSGLSNDHPGRRAAEREIAELDGQRRVVYDRLVGASSKALMDQRRADAYKASRINEKLKTEVDQQIAQTTWFTRNYQEGMQLGMEVDQARKRIDSIQQRIDFLSLEKNAPGFVRMFSSARTPDLPTKGGKRKLFGLVVGAALLLGLLVPLATDALDPAIHTPRDVEAVLGFAPVAWLLDRRAAGPDFAREQTTRLASRIVQDQQKNGSRIFALTSVNAGGGTSTIAMETAAAVIRLGVPALAVEANAYRTDPRYRGSASRGIQFVLRGAHDIGAEIVPGDGDMPDHIPVGDVSAHRNLLEIQHLVEILRDSADSYSVVLIDLPPILVSVDAEFIARGADVAVLVIEADAVTKHDLKRAAACLERIQVPAVSAILNKVSLEAGDGFARHARQEFTVGSGPKSWFARRLWN